LVHLGLSLFLPIFPSVILSKPDPYAFIRTMSLHSAFAVMSLGIALAGCGSAQPALSDNASDFPELLLTEDVVYPLAFGENVRGGVILGDQVFFWTRQGAWLISQAGGRKEIQCPRSMTGIVAAGHKSAGLLVLDTLDQVIRRIDPGGACRNVARVSLGGVIAASPTTAGWLVIERGSVPHRVSSSIASRGEENKRRRGVHLAAISDSFPGQLPAVTESLPSLVSVRDTTHLEWLFLTSTEAGVILGSHRSPASWVVLDYEGLPLFRAHGIASAGPSDALGGQLTDWDVEWHALPPLNVGLGYLQTLADLKSDSREFRLFDATGRLVRSRKVVSPIGFFASDFKSQRLLGTRVTGRTALVVYRWHWQRGVQ
jgi:hypothetical protein